MPKTLKEAKDSNLSFNSFGNKFCYGFLESPETWVDFLQTTFKNKPTKENIIFQDIIKSVVSLNCNLVLIEFDCIDRDYRTMHSSFYDRSYQKTDPTITRIYFFKSPHKEFLSLAEFLKCSSLIGYCNIRPFMSGRVGKCYLPPPAFISKSKFFRITCQTNLNCRINSRCFSIQGMPFIHQDGLVMVCAHSALWMCTRYLSSANSTTTIYPPDVKIAAYKDFGARGLPRPAVGLAVDQIINAVSNLNYPPLFWYFEHRPVNEIVKYILPYLDSCIPVIAGIPGHAVTIIGYTFDESLRQVSIKSSSNSCSLSCLVTGFIAHDDAAGPYRIIPLDDSDDFKQKHFHDVPSSFITSYTISSITSAITFLSERLSTGANDINVALSRQLQCGINTKIGDTYSRELLISSSHSCEAATEWRRMITESSTDKFLIRTYLIDSYQYKNMLQTSSHFQNYSLELRTYLINQPMPRAIWVTEVTTFSRFTTSRTILGDFICDTTGNRYNNMILFAHLPGFIINYKNESVIRPEDIDPITIHSNNDKPYDFGNGDQFHDLSWVYQ